MVRATGKSKCTYFRTHDASSCTLSRGQLLSLADPCRSGKRPAGSVACRNLPGLVARTTTVETEYRVRLALSLQYLGQATAYSGTGAKSGLCQPRTKESIVSIPTLDVDGRFSRREVLAEDSRLHTSVSRMRQVPTPRNFDLHHAAETESEPLLSCCIPPGSLELSCSLVLCNTVEHATASDRRHRTITCSKSHPFLATIGRDVCRNGPHTLYGGNGANEQLYHLDMHAIAALVACSHVRVQTKGDK